MGDKRKRLDTGQYSQPNIQTHVTVYDVTELVRDHSLQLMPLQPIYGPARDADYSR